MCSLGPGLGAGARNGMVRTAVVGIVNDRERGAAGGAADPEGGASVNDGGDGADGVNDSGGIQEDDVEPRRWVVCTTARDAAMVA